MAEIGLVIISFNVQNFVDTSGAIENLGIDNVETIRKNATIAKANATKEIEVAEAATKNIETEKQRALVKEQELNAITRKEADADLYKRQKRQKQTNLK